MPNYALLVGVDEYRDRDITPLEGARNDIDALSQALKSYARFVEDNVFTLVNDEADINEIGIKLEYLADRVQPEDAFLFAFAGHAVVDADWADPYLLTHDSSIGSGLSIRRNLRLDELTRAVAMIPAERKLILLDSCRKEVTRSRGGEQAAFSQSVADAVTRGLGVRPAGERPQSPQAGTVVLFACEVGQRAYEDRRSKRGFFSLAIEEALRGERLDGPLTVNRLEEYLGSRVPDLAKRSLGPSCVQNPWSDRKGLVGVGVWVLTERQARSDDATQSPEEEDDPGHARFFTEEAAAPVDVDEAASHIATADRVTPRRGGMLQGVEDLLLVLIGLAILLILFAFSYGAFQQLR